MSHYHYQLYLPRWLGKALAREAARRSLSVRELLQKILRERYAEAEKAAEQERQAAPHRLHANSPIKS